MSCFCLINIGVYIVVAYTQYKFYVDCGNTSLGFAVKHYGLSRQKKNNVQQKFTYPRQVNPKTTNVGRYSTNTFEIFQPDKISEVIVIQK